MNHVCHWADNTHCEGELIFYKIEYLNLYRVKCKKHYKFDRNSGHSDTREIISKDEYEIVMILQE